jgi:hypothetical protein
MDQNSKQLRRVLLETDFQLGLDVVHAGERKVVRQSAMAGDEQAAADALDHELVNVENLGKLRGHSPQAMLEFRIADDFFGLLEGGRLALDVGEDVGNFGNIVAHVGLQFGDLIVGGFEGHALVEFDVLFDVQTAGKILDTDVMHVEIIVGSDGANAVEDVLRVLRPRERLHGYVGVG